jgi:hypothetical protein
MKTLQEITTLIETLEFDGLYLIHSGFTPILYSLSRDVLVKDLIDCLSESTANQAELLKHIKKLIPEYEEGYGHTHDIHITAYLYALDQVGNLEALNEAIHAMPQATGFFWARKMALKIYEEKLQNLPQKP